MQKANRAPEELSSEEERVVELLFAAFAERDEARAAELIDQSGAAFVDAVRARWGRRLRASRALLDEAERVLDAAEATDDSEERRRQLRLFELLMAAAMQS